MVDLLKQDNAATPYKTNVQFSKKETIEDSYRSNKQVNYLDEKGILRCKDVFHPEPYENQIREQIFLNKAGLRDGAYNTWYPKGNAAKKHNYQNGVQEGRQLTYSLYGAQVADEFFVDGKKQGTQLYADMHGMSKQTKNYVDNVQHGVQVSDHLDGSTSKTYFWQGKDILQPVWWLKENTKDINSVQDITFGKIKAMAIALFKENKNPEPAVIPSNGPKLTN